MVICNSNDKGALHESYAHMRCTYALHVVKKAPFRAIDEAFSQRAEQPFRVV